MNHHLIMIRWLFGCIAAYGMAGNGCAAESQAQEPLFPIAIDHEFPDPRETFEEIKSLILENYYSSSISERDLYWAAVQGMLRHLSPPETPDMCKIFTPEQYEKVVQSLKGVKVSIGIKSTFNQNDGSLTVTEVMEGSPAENILLPYDRILRIDGSPLTGKTLSAINEMLEGDPNTDVTLTVVRDIKGFDLTIKREEFKSANLIVSVLPPGDIALLELNKITAGVADELKKELQKLEDRGVDKLMIDLRHNTGGVFGEALKIAELFLQDKHILLRTLTRSEKVQNYVSSNAEPFEFSTVVLIDAQTASSCEIIVGALQDHKKAVIIGTKTYGKGVFEKTFTLKNNYRVMFISGAMYTPLGKAWQSRGILPDFAVDQDDQTYGALKKLTPIERLQKDVYILTAFKLLNRY